MKSLEKVLLKLNIFKENDNTSFNYIKNDTDFCDVTLVCKNNKTITAHKVILAASSLFFRDILKQIKHPHPVIFMRGIDAADMKSLIDFIYIGQVEIFQNDLDSFFSIAEDLEFKDLIKENIYQNNEEYMEATHYEAVNPKPLTNLDTSQLDPTIDDNFENITDEQKIYPEEKNELIHAIPLEEIVSQIPKNESTKNVKEEPQKSKTDGKYSCYLCKKMFMGNRNLNGHLKAMHGDERQCGKCQVTFADKHELKSHYIHCPYTCSFCKFNSLKKSNFVRHMNDVHPTVMWKNRNV